MEERRQLFQEKALKKLRTPERQDVMFSIVPPLGWGVFLSICVVIVSILIWSFFGVMAEKVKGYGMILDTAGSARISHVAGGQIYKLLAESGERVKTGDVVALISQPQSRQSMYLQMEQAGDALSEAELQARTSELSSVREQHYYETNVVSPYDGIITNVRVHAGDIVSAGQTIYDVRCDQNRDDIKAVVFVPALEGGKIEKNSRIQIMPGAVDSTESGALIGRVVDVASFPVTSERIVYWTGNKEYADWVIQNCQGPVIEVTVELIKDKDTKSGYLWTSIMGADKEIKAGMSCTAQAIVKREAPVVKACKKLSQWVRSD